MIPGNNDGFRLLVAAMKTSDMKRLLVELERLEIEREQMIVDREESEWNREWKKRSAKKRQSKA